jgi:hypothetical protein
VYDSGGVLLASFPGESFLYASEVKYILLPNQAIPNGVAHVDLTITNANWVNGDSGAAPHFGETIITQVGSSTTVAAGQLTNQDVVPFKNILIIAIFKDAQGNPIGASQTVFDSITASQTKPFSIFYPALANVDSTRTEVEAYAAR